MNTLKFFAYVCAALCIGFSSVATSYFEKETVVATDTATTEDTDANDSSSSIESVTSLEDETDFLVSAN